MFLLALLRYALLLLTPVALLSTTYLYLYPVFHLCAFPSPSSHSSSYLTTLLQHTPLTSHPSPPSKLAPFRLLALGDPQLEGESSIRDIHASLFPHFHSLLSNLSPSTTYTPLTRLRHSLHDLIDLSLLDLPSSLEILRKRIDFIGNDYYLGLIYQSLLWWTNPSHVVVLGDLVGSQWIDDEEFEERGWRFWNRVFRGGRRVEDEVAREPSEDFQGVETIGEDTRDWRNRVINVAGNHDIGYAGDLTEERLERFVRVFGKANYELRFQLPSTTTPSFPNSNSNSTSEITSETPPPELRLILLNSMNLDTPALSDSLQASTYSFLNTIITTSHPVTHPSLFTLLLTHIPLHKPTGVCVDGPYFDFFSEDEAPTFNGVREQNHLSAPASRGLLEGIFGLSGDPNAPGGGYGRNGVVLNGHDHEGCDVYHYINQSEPPEREWKARRWGDVKREGVNEEEGVPGLREVTVRSMMGDFGGNAGLLSVWFENEGVEGGDGEWRFEFENCALGTQHRWWAVHILDLVVLGGAALYVVLGGLKRAGLLKDGDGKGKMQGKADARKDEMVKANGAAKGLKSTEGNGHLPDSKLGKEGRDSGRK